MLILSNGKQDMKNKNLWKPRTFWFGSEVFCNYINCNRLKLGAGFAEYGRVKSYVYVFANIHKLCDLCFETKFENYISKFIE